MKKLGIALLSLVGVILVIGLIAPLFLSWETYEPKVKQMVLEQTGYEFTIDGGVSLGLLPLPGASVKNVSVYNPKLKDKPLLVLEHADISVNPIALLFGNISISSVTLKNGSLLYFKGKDGGANVITKPQATIAEDNISSPADEEQGQVVADAQSAPSFALDNLYLENILLQSIDQQAGAQQTLKVNDGYASISSLQGPFSANAEIVYNDRQISLDADLGDFATKEKVSARLLLEEGETSSKVFFDGMVNLQNLASVDGDFEVAFQALEMQGKLRGTNSSVSFEETTVSLGGAEANVSLNLAGIDSGDYVLTSEADFTSPINVEDIIKALPEELRAQDRESANENNSSNDAKASQQGELDHFLPSQLMLPANFVANIRVTAPSVVYRGEQTGKISLVGKSSGKTLNVNLLAEGLPHASNIEATSVLGFSGAKPIDGNEHFKYYQNPALDIAFGFDTENLTNLVTWLDVAAESAIPEGMPQNLSLKGHMKVRDRLVRLDLRDSKIGESSLKGAFDYVLPDGASSAPLITVNLDAGRVVLPDFIGDGQGSNGANDGSASSVFGGQTSQDEGLNISSQLEKFISKIAYDLNVSMSAKELLLGDRSFKGARLALVKDEDVLKIRQLQVSDHMGTSVSLNGAIRPEGDLYRLALNASLKSANIDRLMTAYNIELPQSVPTPIGALQADIEAQSNTENLSFDTDIKAYGFSANMRGALNDLFKPEIPQTLRMSLKHPNSEEALKFFSPNYKADSSLMNKPFSLVADINRNANSLNIQNMNLSVGPSNISGVSVVTLGQVPHIKANIKADNLPVKVLLGGREERSNTASSTSSGTASNTDGGTPWSREAIDTAALRAVNAEINIVAQKFAYGRTVLSNAKVIAKLEDGVLNISDISGSLEEGALKGNLMISAKQADQPISIEGRLGLVDSTISAVTRGLLGHSTRKLDGGMSFDLDFTATGISSAALINALNGDGNVQLIDPVVRGLNVKAIYETARNVESVQGALSALLQNQLTGGETQLNSVDKSFKIVNGVIPIENWETKTDEAVIVSNGRIDFPNWKIDVLNTIQIDKVKDIPSFGMRISGPLHAPSTQVTRESLESFLQSRLGDKARDFITDKLISEDVQNKVRDKIGVGIDELLPLGRREQQQVPTNDNTQQEQQQMQEQQAPQPSVEERLIRGLFDRLAE